MVMNVRATVIATLLIATSLQAVTPDRQNLASSRGLALMLPFEQDFDARGDGNSAPGQVAAEVVPFGRSVVRNLKTQVRIPSQAFATSIAVTIERPFTAGFGACHDIHRVDLRTDLLCRRNC